MTRHKLAALLICVALAGCDGVPVEPSMNAWNDWLVVDANYGLAGDSTVWATIEVTNSGTEALVGTTSYSCGWVFAGHAAAQRSGTPAWVQDETGRTCFDRLLEVRVEPGATFTFPVAEVGPLGAMLQAVAGDTVHLTATLRFVHGDDEAATAPFPAGVVVRTAPPTCTGTGCGAGGTELALPGWQLLQLDVTYGTSATADVWASVSALNTGSDTLRGFAGSYCAWWFAAYADASRTGVPYWRQNAADRTCFQEGLDLYIEPGRAFTFRRAQAVGPFAQIASGATGDSIYLTATLRFRHDGTDYETAPLVAGAVAR